MKYLIIALSTLLIGCAHTDTKKPDAIITEKTIRIDNRALQPCKDLAVIEQVTFEAVLVASINNAEIYLDCKNKQNASIKLLKELGNIK